MVIRVGTLYCELLVGVGDWPFHGSCELPRLVEPSIRVKEVLSMLCFDLYSLAMTTRPRVFRDPVHVNVEFSRALSWDVLGLSLIDTPEVQRLRRIRQLGLAS